MTGVSEDLREETKRQVRHVARRVYRILDLNGYRRIDFPLDDQNRLYVLEANPNPQIAQYEDFALSAAHDGLPYPDLLQRILVLGLRWNPTRRG